MAVMKTGTRSRVSRAVRTAAKAAPQKFIELVSPFLPELVEILFADARDRKCVGHRTAVNALLDGLEITRGNERLLERILERLDARNEEQLAAGMQLLRAVEGVNLADAEAVAIETLRRAIKAEPHKRARIREAVFGEREITETMPALNGHTHEGRTNGAVL